MSKIFGDKIFLLLLYYRNYSQLKITIMKKLFAFAVLFAAVSLVACGGNEKKDEKKDDATVACAEACCGECTEVCAEECCGECTEVCAEECCGECTEACTEACCGECAEVCPEECCAE